MSIEQADTIQMALLVVTVLCFLAGITWSGGETGTSKVGKHTGKYQRGLSWFRYVNGRPDEEGVWRVCRYSGA